MKFSSLNCLGMTLLLTFSLSAQESTEPANFQNLGEETLNKGEVEKAISYFTRAIEEDSTALWSYYYRGLSYASQRRYERAIQDYNRILELDPSMSEVYEYRGIAYSQDVDFKKAEDDFHEAISRHPEQASLYNNLGYCYLKMRKYEKTVEQCSKAIELDTSYLLAYGNRGWARYQLGEYKKALQDLEKATRLDPNSPNRKLIMDHYTKAAVAVESGYASAPDDLYRLDEAGKYYALIIGNNEYEDSRLTSLDKPIRDATSLYEILTSSYTFDKDNVFFLKNASRGDIIEAFDELNRKMTKADNLLIFYAGHGYWDKERQSGYWLPVDANKDKTTNWLRNSTIQGYIAEIPSHHTLLIADACFGGGIFKTRRAFEDAPSSIENIYKLTSRKGMTSGMLNEVPDRSVFMEYLLKRLDQNSEKYITSLTLFTQFRDAVMNNSNNAPQYGTIHNTGDEGGDFVFVKKE